MMVFPTPPINKKGWPWTTDIPKFPEKMPNGHNWPKISIVTPSYSQGQFIEATIRSILLQGYPNLEYFVIDGGSKDNTIDILKKYDTFITKWVSEPDKGQTNAINKGLSLIAGDIFAYLNSDDLFLPGALRTAALYLTSHPDVSMVYGNIIHIDENGEIIERIEVENFDYDRLLSWKLTLPQPATFMKADIIKRIGLFDERLDLGMDHDYWMRIGLNHKIDHLNEYLGCARMYKQIKSLSRYLDYVDEHISMLDKLFSEGNISAELIAKKSQYYSSVYYYGGRGHIFHLKFLKGLKYLFYSFIYNPTTMISSALTDLKKLKFLN